MLQMLRQQSTMHFQSNGRIGCAGGGGGGDWGGGETCLAIAHGGKTHLGKSSGNESLARCLAASGKLHILEACQAEPARS